MIDERFYEFIINYRSIKDWKLFTTMSSGPSDVNQEVKAVRAGAHDLRGQS